MMTVWVSCSVGSFQNTIWVMNGSRDNFLIGQFSPWVRALLIVPSHCFPSLVIALGVVQMYTVKRRMREAIGVLMIHFWIAVLMFTSFNWLIGLTGIVSGLQSYASCVLLSLVVNPAIFVFFYFKWKRERHYPEVGDVIHSIPRIASKPVLRTLAALEMKDCADDNHDKESESDPSIHNTHDDDSVSTNSNLSDNHSENNNSENNSNHSDDTGGVTAFHTDTTVELSALT